MSNSLEHSGTLWRGQECKHERSLIDTFDARVRIVWVAIFSCVVVLSNVFAVALVGLCCSLSLVFVGRLNLKRVIRRVMAMDMFMIFLIIMLPFTTPGDPLFVIFGLTASIEGLLHALLIAVKANTVVLSLLAVVGTLSATQLGHALGQLGLSNKLVHLLLFTVRYLDVIGQEYKRMRRAMQARAFVLKANRHTWSSIGFLIGMLLIRALERSERIMHAMKCRGYKGHFYLLAEQHFARQDYILMFLCVPFFISLMLLNLV